jgi:hypothetical protein
MSVLNTKTPSISVYKCVDDLYPHVSPLDIKLCAHVYPVTFSWWHINWSFRNFSNINFTEPFPSTIRHSPCHVSGLSLWRAKFHTKPVHLESLVNKGALQLVFAQVLRCLLSLSLYRHYIIDWRCRRIKHYSLPLSLSLHNMYVISSHSFSPVDISSPNFSACDNLAFTFTLGSPDFEGTYF